MPNARMAPRPVQLRRGVRPLRPPPPHSALPPPQPLRSLDDFPQRLADCIDFASENGSTCLLSSPVFFGKLPPSSQIGPLRWVGRTVGDFRANPLGLGSAHHLRGLRDLTAGHSRGEGGTRRPPCFVSSSCAVTATGGGPTSLRQDIPALLKYLWFRLLLIFVSSRAYACPPAALIPDTVPSTRPLLRSNVR